MDRPQKLSLADLVAAEREVGPDLAAEGRVWAEVERRLIHGPPPVALPGPGAAAAILKLIGGLVLVGGLVGVAALLVREPPVDEPPVPAPTLVRATDQAVLKDMPPMTWPLRQVKPPAPPVAELRAPVERVRRPAPTDEASEVLDLEAELRLIAAIRAALKRGDGKEALARVAEHRQKFGARGVLVQERSAHEVEALCAVGREAEARRMAAEFLRKWPESPHRARVTASCAGG